MAQQHSASCFRNEDNVFLDVAVNDDEDEEDARRGSRGSLISSTNSRSSTSNKVLSFNSDTDLSHNFT